MKRIVVLFTFFLSLCAFGQDIENDLSKFVPFIQSLNNFSKNIPQEKVYLHFDNTSYYQGDNIWFKCYIVAFDRHQLSPLSKTLYVELLNPGGEIIDKRILEIENGQCYGDFALNQLPFYSGFYEVRAYTKYMLNFGDDIIFSRLLPVFDKPKTEGNYEEKEMLPYGRFGTGHYPMKRERPIKEKTVNLRFFPEGGNLIQGIASRVAFEATDEVGNPIDVMGIVMDAAKQKLCSITTLHEGKGVFTYTPRGGKQRDVAEVEYSGKKYRFDMPTSLQQGVTMAVDNLPQSDSIAIILQKNSNTSAEMLGVAVLHGGTLQDYSFVWVANDVEILKMDKTQLPAGVSQIVLFNDKGGILCDRLIFTGKQEAQLEIKVKTDKRFYMPLELVDMEFSLTDRDTNPVQTTFSIAVRDGVNGVENKHNILTDLLLMSEIKGYVRNPAYYFEENDNTRCAALDLLLMVQGWRRYSWKQMTGVEDFEIKYLPEQGIETNGKVVYINTRGKQVQKMGVNVDMFLLKRGVEDESGGDFVETFVTDESGGFSFVSDVHGKWSMILAATEKGKRKNYSILLDRLFSPEPRKYRYADLQVSISETIKETVEIEGTSDDENIKDDLDYASFFSAYQDSLSKLGIEMKVHQLSEVAVRARKNRAQNIYQNRSTSVAYYDVVSESDDIYDRVGYASSTMQKLLTDMNSNLSIKRDRDYEVLVYKNYRMALVVINYEQHIDHNNDIFKWQSLSPNAVKSIYINGTPSLRCQYADPRIPCKLAVDIFNCVIFIETYLEGETPVEAAKGIRKTWLDGYSEVKEFYSPDYSAVPQGFNDYRRTLYWNPSLTSDETGKAKINFYNNSRAVNFSISAETVTPLGMTGVNKNE